MDDIPIRFIGITKQQLEDSLKNKTPIIITTYYMGDVEVKFPIVVKEITEHKKEVCFYADSTTPDGKEWNCCGYIVVGKDEGVMAATLKNS